MALYPLCNHQKELPEAVAYAASAIRERKLDSTKRADLLTTLGIFGMLKDRTLDVLSIIGREQMHESPFYDIIAEKGTQIQARKNILQVLKIRYGAKAIKEFEPAVNKIDKLDQLDKLHRLAVKSRRLSEFRRAIPKE